MSEYNSIFSDQTMQKLSQQSAQSLRDLLGNKNWMQAMRDITPLVSQVMQAEAPHREELTNLAVYILKQTYPIIDQAGIDVQAEIVGMEDLGMDQNPNETDEMDLGDPRLLCLHQSGDDVGGQA